MHWKRKGRKGEGVNELERVKADWRGGLGRVSVKSTNPDFTEFQINYMYCINKSVKQKLHYNNNNIIIIYQRMVGIRADS